MSERITQSLMLKGRFVARPALSRFWKSVTGFSGEALRQAEKRARDLLAGAVALYICFAATAEPMQTGGAQPVEFSIPPQPLADALHAYQQQMRVQVLYEARAAAGRQSVAVVGKFLPDAALRRLLSGTDLEVVRAGPEAIALVSPRPQERDVPPVSPLETADLSLGELHVRAAASPSRSDQFQDYNESVRAEIERVLRKNVKTGSGNYRAVIDLWIDSARRVQKVALLGSTGETARDAAISAALRGLTINRPTPANAPQPLRVIVTVRTAQ